MEEPGGLPSMGSHRVGRNWSNLAAAADGTGCHDLSFWILSFKPTFSLFSFTFIKRLFSSSLPSAIRVVSCYSILAALFTIAKIWKQPKCLSMDDQIKKLYISFFLSLTPTHIHYGILFSHKNVWNLAISNNMDVPQGHYAKWNTSEKINTKCSILHVELNKQTNQAHQIQEQIVGCQRQQIKCKRNGWTIFVFLQINWKKRYKQRFS